MRLDVLADDRERALRQAGEQPVGDRRGRERRLQLARGQRAGRVVGQQRFTRDHARRGAHPVRRERRTREQAAAADGRDHHVEVGDLFHQLERRGTRAGDHPIVVEGMDLRRAGTGDDLGERRGARLGRVVARGDLRAVGEHRGALHRAHRVGHHDERRDASRARPRARAQRRGCPTSARRHRSGLRRRRVTAPHSSRRGT